MHFVILEWKKNCVKQIKTDGNVSWLAKIGLMIVFKRKYIYAPVLVMELFFILLSHRVSSPIFLVLWYLLELLNDVNNWYHDCKTAVRKQSAKGMIQRATSIHHFQCMRILKSLTGVRSMWQSKEMQPGEWQNSIMENCYARYSDGYYRSLSETQLLSN